MVGREPLLKDSVWRGRKAECGERFEWPSANEHGRHGIAIRPLSTSSAHGAAVSPQCCRRPFHLHSHFAIYSARRSISLHSLQPRAAQSSTNAKASPTTPPYATPHHTTRPTRALSLVDTTCHHNGHNNMGVSPPHTSTKLRRY